MREETELRTGGFLGGIPVELADGQLWAFPGPRELSPEGQCRDPHLLRLLAEFGTEEDEAERCRMELALAIHLLSWNYTLTPAEYEALFATSDPGLNARLKASFRDLATRHIEAVRSVERAADRTPRPARGRRFRFPVFRPHKENLEGPRRAAC